MFRGRSGAQASARAWRQSRQLSRNLARLLSTLPRAQYRVATALISNGACPTYAEVAENLDLSIGSVHQHLRRIRLGRPKVYSALMKERARQLKARHREALKRTRDHTFRWHRLTGYRYLWFDPRDFW
jgi:hypothetical protein